MADALPVFNDQDLGATLDGLGRMGPVRFLQIGAMDGKRFDPLHDFVRRYGWEGLLVEALPDFFAALKANYADCSGLHFVNAAIMDYNGQAVMQRIDPAAVTQGLISPHALGIATAREGGGVWHSPQLKPEARAVLEQFRQEVTVPCMTVDQLLAALPWPGLDLVVIDTEGMDWVIARQIDLTRWQPRLFYMEYVHLGAAEQVECLAHFAAAGYRAHRDVPGYNFLFIRDEQAGAVQAA
jgi:FkbM family methyltransferase